MADAGKTVNIFIYILLHIIESSGPNFITPFCDFELKCSDTGQHILYLFEHKKQFIINEGSLLRRCSLDPSRSLTGTSLGSA